MNIIILTIIYSVVAYIGFGVIFGLAIDLLIWALEDEQYRNMKVKGALPIYAYAPFTISVAFCWPLIIRDLIKSSR